MFKKIVLLPVRFYRKYISPLSPPSCRFEPTCSQYCIDAVEEWGVICGLGLSAWRIMRCNPWGKGGHDPVPPCPWNRKRRLREKNKNHESEEK